LDPDKIVEKLTQNGDLNAQLELGYRYTKGVRGTAQDLRKASQWHPQGDFSYHFIGSTMAELW